MRDFGYCWDRDCVSNARWYRDSQLYLHQVQYQSCNGHRGVLNSGQNAYFNENCDQAGYKRTQDTHNRYRSDSSPLHSSSHAPSTPPSGDTISVELRAPPHDGPAPLRPRGAAQPACISRHAGDTGAERAAARQLARGRRLVAPPDRPVAARPAADCAAAPAPHDERAPALTTGGARAAVRVAGARRAFRAAGS